MSNKLISCSINMYYCYYYYYQYLKQQSIFSTRIPWWIVRFKDQHFSEIKSCCNIIHSKAWSQSNCLFWGNKWYQLILVFCKDALNWSKVMIKMKMFMIHERNLKRFYSAVFNIIIMIITMSSILEWFLKDHDTEDWSNDAESFVYMNKLHFQIYSNRKQLF